MLEATFDAAYAGLPLPVRVTPLKMLPLREPPPVIRPTHFAARQPASPRNLAHDVYLYCDTRDANLGRITSTVPAGDENDSRVTVTTTLGRFVLHSDGKIERGKLLKESLHGCYTSRRASQ